MNRTAGSKNERNHLPRAQKSASRPSAGETSFSPQGLHVSSSPLYLFDRFAKSIFFSIRFSLFFPAVNFPLKIDQLKQLF
jgi:hypothetical protein